MTWDEVWAIAASLAPVTRGSYHGYPAIRLRESFVVRLSDDHASIEFKSIPPDEREMLLATQPDVFHLPPGLYARGVYVRLDALDEATLRRMLEARFRVIGPKRVRR